MDWVSWQWQPIKRWEEKREFNAFFFGFRSILFLLFSNSNQQIAGVALNGVLVDGDVEKAFENLQCIDDEKFKKIFSFLYSHNLEVNLFEQFDVDRIFELRILSVNSKYRGQGIARQLVVKSEKIAEENGFKLIKSDATSFITYKICAPLGFVVCSEKRFDEYLDANGEQIFHTESPHESNKILCKLLDHEHVTSF